MSEYKFINKLMDDARSAERAKLREAVSQLERHTTITGSGMDARIVDCYLVSDIAAIFDKEEDEMNMIEGIQTEQARVRELLKQYEDIGPFGVFGAMTLKQAIQHGDKSVASGDVVDMLAAYQELKGCTG